jgi:hypothetical protein
MGTKGGWQFATATRARANPAYMRFLAAALLDKL